MSSTPKPSASGTLTERIQRRIYEIYRLRKSLADRGGIRTRRYPHGVRRAFIWCRAFGWDHGGSVRRWLRALIFGSLAVTTTEIYGAQIEQWGAPDLLHQQDKQQHFAGGVVTAALVNLLLADQGAPWYERAAIDVGSSALVGLAKEAYDYKHPRNHDCDPKDFLATTAGGAAYFALSYTWRF